MKDQNEKKKRFLSVFSQTPRVLMLVWRAHPLGALVLPLAALLTAPLPAAYLYCIKKVIDGVTLWIGGDAAAGKAMILAFFAAAAALKLAQRVIDSLQFFTERSLMERLEIALRGQILEHASTLDPAFFETPQFQDVLRRTWGDVSVRSFTIMSSVLRGLSSVGALCGYAVLLMGLAWWVFPALFVLALPGFAVLARFGLAGWFIRHSQTQERRRMDYVGDLLVSQNAAKELRLFRLEPYFLRLWRDTAWKFYTQDRAHWTKYTVGVVCTETFRTLGGLGLYGYAIYRTVLGTGPTIGSLYMYIQSIDSALSSIGMTLQALGSLYENNLYMSHLFEFLGQKPILPRPENPSPAAPPRQSVRFEGVTFRYPSGESDVLTDVSFEIRAGERVAVVGENGAGKTTLVKLLTRLYDPRSGRIEVDGTDLTQFAPGDWQKHIGVIFQDFSRFAVTARENIGFGRIEDIGNTAGIEAAADLSGASDKIARLKKGWETILGTTFDDSEELSGGEWQRIALARAFFSEAPILILDEPTASLDAKQEYEVYRQFNELTRGKTTILITHRLASVRMADRILVLDHGRLAESGTHDELMALDGQYAALFTRQASSYLNGAGALEDSQPTPA